jgi:CheY-like chemotaxis protein
MDKLHILVIDSDEGFGMMLKEGLQQSGLYTADWAISGRQSAQVLKRVNYDLVIVDMALDDVPPAALIQAIRKAKNGIKIMVIPIMGQAVPKTIMELKVDGVLTKPFFVGDLPELVDKAMGRKPRIQPPPPLPQPSPPPAKAKPSVSTADTPAPVTPVAPIAAPVPVISAVSSDTLRYLRASEKEIVRLLDDLNREVRAEAILLIAGGELIAQAGMLGQEQCQDLTGLISQSAAAAAQAATFLGEPAGRFVQSLHEGEAYRLYSLSLSEGIQLSLALSSNVPLGMIRHQCRLIAEKMTRFII